MIINWGFMWGCICLRLNICKTSFPVRSKAPKPQVRVQGASNPLHQTTDSRTPSNPGRSKSEHCLNGNGAGPLEGGNHVSYAFLYVLVVYAIDVGREETLVASNPPKCVPPTLHQSPVQADQSLRSYSVRVRSLSPPFNFNRTGEPQPELKSRTRLRNALPSRI